MRNNKNKGFTLVELLVVIAILAILATVSVVGYTSFIKSAHISNDENIAAQLNQFLAAYQADHTTEHYGKPITEDNIWEITQTILKDSQLGELEPHAKDYGYHYYFKFDGQGGGQYVARDEEGLTSSMLMRLWNTFVSAESPKAKAGLFLENGVEYFLVDTKGSTIADAIRGFYSFGNIEGTTSAQKFAAFVEIIDKLEEEGEYPEVVALAKTSVFATKEGNYAFNATNTHTNLYVHDDATFVDNKIYSVDDEGNLSGSKYLDATTPLLTITKDTKIVIPSGVSLPAHSLHIAGNGAVATIVINAKDWDTLKTTVDANFTNATTVIMLNNKEYKLVDVTDANDITYPCKDVYTMDGEFVLTLGDNFALTDFTLTLQDVKDKVLNFGTTSTVALDNLTFTPKLVNINKISNKPASSTSNASLKWSIVSIKINQEDDVITDADTIKTYVTIDEITGVITFVKDEDTDLLPKVDEVVIKGAARTDESINSTLTLDVWRIVGANYSLDGKVTPVSSCLTYKANDNKFTLALSGTPTYNKSGDVPAGLVVSAKLDIAYTNAGLTNAYDEATNVHTLTTSDAADGSAKTLKVVIGGYVQHSQELVVVDGADFTLKAANNGNMTVLGNNGVITLSDIFTGTAPAGAEIRLATGTANDDFLTWNRIPLDHATSSSTSFGVTYSDDVAEKLEQDATGTYIPYIPYDGNIQFVKNTYKTVEGATEGTFEKILIAVYLDGVRISEDVEVIVVDGKNVRGLADFTGATNYVVLADLDIDDSTKVLNDGKTWAFSNGTIYGNGFEFDITKGSTIGTFGIITLTNATLKDMKIAGQLYGDVGIGAQDEWGSNVIHATGTTTIENCYLANTRAPLCAGSEENKTADVVTVINSVLYGGRYANIDLRGGTLKFEGKVITINQPHTNLEGTAITTETNKVMGLGVAVWLEAGKDTNDVTGIEGVQNLVQYNFMPSTYTGLPVLEMEKGGLTVQIDTKTAFTKAFNSAQAGHKFGDTVKYLNSGIIGEDLGEGINTLTSRVLSMTFPIGDRTGLSASSDRSYVELKVAPGLSANAVLQVAFKGALAFLKMMGINTDVSVHLYSMTDTTVNQTVFKNSDNAEYIYSPWTQSVTVGSGESAKTTEYEAYGFTDGKILPESMWSNYN